MDKLKFALVSSNILISNINKNYTMQGGVILYSGKLGKILIEGKGKLYTIKNNELVCIGYKPDTQNEVNTKVKKYGVSLDIMNNDILNTATKKISSKICVIYVNFTYDDFDFMWNELEDNLKENRFFIDKNLDFFNYCLDFFDDYIIKKNDFFYRSRINEGDKEFKLEDLGAPPVNKCCVGRLNPNKIQYLYLSNNPKTSILEVRPWIGSIVEVGKFIISKNENLILKDLSYLDENIIIEKLRKVNLTKNQKKNILNNELQINEARRKIGNLFSRPISQKAKEEEYLITQCITEYIRDYLKNDNDKKYDGIKYASSADKYGFNVVIFNPNFMKIIKKESIEKVNSMTLESETYSFI